MVLKAKETEAALIKKGFNKVEGHHHYYVFEHENKIVARTRMSHNGQEINDFLIAQMRKQCQLSKYDFIDLIKCPLSKEEYIAKLKQAGAID